MTTNGSLNRKFRMALVGGGHGAFIGRVHAIAALMDNRAELVAGCLSSNPDRAKASAPDYDIRPERAYTSIAELVQKHFDLRPKGIVQMLDLLRPIYEKTAAYGHFGRTEKEFTWERTDRKDALRDAAGARVRRAS